MFAQWKEEWHTVATKSLGSDGTIMFDGYYGSYTYSLTAYDQALTLSIRTLKHLYDPTFWQPQLREPSLVT